MLGRSLQISIIAASLLIACNKEPPEAPPETRSPSPVADQKVIYGRDNRHEYFEEKSSQVRAVANSTVALIKTEDLSENDDGTFKADGTPYGTAERLCPSERYRDQETPAFCSGFLVAPNLVVTAGHCITNARDCSEVSFVFGFANRAPDQTPDPIPTSDIYKCSRVLHTQSPAKGADFAVIKLDRKVTNHTPLQLRDTGSVEKGDGVFVVGYPAGLPMKIADGARIRDPEPDGYFVANLDTFGGNSGSAVFNAKTLEVEGVLVRGENDFVFHSEEGCYVSNVCPEDGCRGEDVTKISEVRKFLGHRAR